MDMSIRMVDLSSRYLRLKEEIDTAVRNVFESADYINGAPVKTFCERLSAYMDVPHVIPCGNATDALRLALQALQIGPGHEVIAPAFTYIAPVEAIASTGAVPVIVDVDPQTFNINETLIEKAITVRTKAIIAVHLFGQSCDMEAIQRVAGKYKLAIIEDNAQSLGASYIFGDNRIRKTGAIGHIGVTSFFPTKPLACYGDGGAIFTSDDALAEHLRLLANHGQTEKYRHKLIGCNSRLDTVQAAILNVKLNYLDEFTERRRQIAARYDRTLNGYPEIVLPAKRNYSTHVYHQYTIQVKNGKRNALKTYLAGKNISSMIYYPFPVHEQEAYKWVVRLFGDTDESERLCNESLSLPIHSELTDEMQTTIIETVDRFFS
ncbi:MAG: DegT/DnrJ/EryC1/StrS family aminotransferase, partial [Tannerella sp.]|nr:DegT/DnrJ/EryC1/StrS family aminotransferase [Tannerella sp.]